MGSKNITTRNEKNTNPLSNFHGEMNDFFDRFVKEIFPDKEQSNFIPKIEVKDEENQYIVSAEIPGMKEEDIDISFEDNTLILQGEKQNESKREGKGYYRSEMSYGSFYRAIPMSKDINSDTISATYDKGVLSVTFEKNPESNRKSKKISIGSKNSHKH
jgi:HSP20 family protein